MDAEKRHQLKQNELAEALAKLRNLRELGGKREVLYWTAAIVVVLAAFLAYRYWEPIRAGAAARVWREFLAVSQKVDSNTPGATDELRGLTESSNPVLAAAARLRLAATLRNKATETDTVDMAALQQSAEVLKPLLDQPGLPPVLTGAAGLSLATSYEALGQFDDAQRVYNILLDEQRFAGTGYPNAAAERLKMLPELRKPVQFVAGMPPQPAPATAPTISVTPASEMMGPMPGPAPMAPPTLPGAVPPAPGAVPLPSAPRAPLGAAAPAGAPADAGAPGTPSAAQPQQPAEKAPGSDSEPQAPATQP